MTGESEIKVDCPKCLASLKVPTEKGGTRIVCPECKRSLQVPAAQSAGNAIFDDLFDSPSDPPEQGEIKTPVSSPEVEAKESPVAFDESAFDNIEAAIDEHRVAEQMALETQSQESVESEASPPAEDPLASLTGADTELESPEPSVPGLSIPDEFSLEDHLQTSDLDLTPIAGEDPFDEDSDKPLNIDGISPTIKVDNIIGVKCKVCDTRIHVNVDQSGETIECPMCFSKVEVTIPSSIIGVNHNSPVSPNMQLADNDSGKTESDSRQQMEKLPEFDDSPLELAPLEPDNPLPSETATKSEDLLKPKYVEPVGESPDQEDDIPVVETETEEPRPNKKRKTKKKTEEYGSKDYWESKVTEVEPDEIDLPEIFTHETLSLKLVVGWIGRAFTSPELIYRTLVAVAMLGFAYTMFDVFHYSYHSEDIGKVYKILGTILPSLVGGCSLIVGLLALFTSCSMVFQISLNGLAKSEDWPGFSFSDWLGPLMLFTFSFWLGCLPGGLLGSFFAITLQQNTWIVVGATLSAFLLAPILYTCVTFNGSAFNVVAKEVFRTFRGDDVSWLYYLPFTLAVWFGFLIGTLIMFIPTFVFSVAGASLQVLAMICFAAISGVHTGRMMHKLQKSM